MPVVVEPFQSAVVLQSLAAFGAIARFPEVFTVRTPPEIEGAIMVTLPLTALIVLAPVNPIADPVL